MTKNGTKMTCIIAIGYGGQNEIIRAVRKCISAGVDTDSLDEKIFLQYMDSGMYPAPDMIVRTGGHIRHSGMYLYHSEYSEYYFTSTLWPDFGRVDIEKALLQYENAHRKYGK
jgi:undecaprenyl diphosphate synthase